MTDTAEVGRSASSSGVSLYNRLGEDSKELQSNEEIGRTDRTKNTVIKEEQKQFLMVERQMQYYWRSATFWTSPRINFSVVMFLYQYLA